MRVSPPVLKEALALLSGTLLDSSGTLLTEPARSVVVAQTSLTAIMSGDRGIREAVDARTSVAILIPLAARGPGARAVAAMLARFRVWCARRVLVRSGATQVRVVAIVGAGDSVFLAYELGTTGQRYVESWVVLEPPRSRPVGLAKDAVGALAGVSTAADLLVAVGERP